MTVIGFHDATVGAYGFRTFHHFVPDKMNEASVGAAVRTDLVAADKSFLAILGDNLAFQMPTSYCL